MTNEEIDQFKLEIYNNIIPHVINMPEEKIVEIIKMVEKDNPDLPKGFGNMLYEQILVIKYRQ